MLLIPDDAWEMRGRAFSADDAEKQNRGIFATQPIGPGTVIGDYLGLLIPTEREAEYETGPDVYLMYYDERLAIWPDPATTGLHVVNHACEPTCGIVTYQSHTLYVALRQIHPDEELTVSYLLGPIDDACAPCRHACWCRARSCTGSMHLPIERYAAWRRFDDRASARTKRPGLPEAPPLEAYQPLPPLDRYPARVGDGGFHALFGSTTLPPLIRQADRLPGLADLRRELRRTGRRLTYGRLGLTVLGVDGTTVVIDAAPA